MLGRRLQNTVVVGMTSLAILPLVFIVVSRNAQLLNGISGTVVFLIVILGLLTGLAGGVALAIVRKNPLWLIAAASALCAGYVWSLVAIGMGMSRMH